MEFTKKLKLISCFTVFMILSGCSSTKAITQIKSTNLAQYESIVINEVKVYSTEESAKTNLKLQEKLKNWQSYARAELVKYAKSSKYTHLESANQATKTTLIFDLDVNVMYGNRALRWAVGFGAGKGGVYSVLTVLDAKTSEVLFKGKADSDMNGGGAGGDINVLLQENINKLIAQYEKG